MDSVDLIARENEFKKLNKQLEKKTESLMKEIEEVMQKPDIFSIPNFKRNLYNDKPSGSKHRCANFSPTTEDCGRTNLSHMPKDVWKKDCVTKSSPKLIGAKQDMKVNKPNSAAGVEKLLPSDHSTPDITDAQKVVCSCCVKDKMSDELEFLYAFVSVSVKENILPQSYFKGNVTVESVCKCLSAKIKLMQDQLDELHRTIDKKNKQCEAHLTHTAELETERLTLLNTANTMKSETADMKAKYLAIQNRLNEKDRLYKEQRSAADKLAVEVKQYRSQNSSLEGRCAAQEESLAAARQQLEAAKLAEKEYRNSTRSLSLSHEATIRRLQSQLRVLRWRLAQYSALVDNLRAQRSLLGAQQAVYAVDEQYNRLLQEGE